MQATIPLLKMKPNSFKANPKVQEYGLSYLALMRKFLHFQSQVFLQLRIHEPSEMNPDLNRFLSLPSELLCLSCLDVWVSVTVSAQHLWIFVCFYIANVRNLLGYPLILYIPNPQHFQLQPWKPNSMSPNLFPYCVNLHQPILVSLSYCEQFPLVPCIFLSSHLLNIYLYDATHL